MKTMRNWGKFLFGSLVLFPAVVILSACQSKPPQITMTNARAVLSPAIVGEALVTMNIVNQGGSDVLKGVKTDIPEAKASFHVMQGQRMVVVDMVEVLSMSTFELKMDGSHVMIENMPKAMTKGANFKLMLIFDKSGEKIISLTLEDAPTMPMDNNHPK